MKRQHPAWIVLSAIRSLRALALPLVIAFVSGGRPGEGWFLVVAGGAAVLGLVGRAVAWWQFRYEVSGGGLRVHSGVLARRERFIPLERIQAVDLNETLLQRLVGVVGVKIETAAGGGGAADVTLEAVTRGEADRLRERLAQRRPAGAPTAVAGEGAAGAEPVLVATGSGALIRGISPGELLVAGLTSGRIGPALAVLSFGFQLLDDVLPDRIVERLAMSASGWTLRGAITIAVVVGVGAWVLAVVSTALTYGGFELRRDGDRLVIAHGLLERRRRSIPLGRIQAVTITEGLLRQPFGLAAVRFESAGYGKDTPESGVLFPLVRVAEVPALLQAACPAFAADLDPATLAPPPPRARGRYALAGVWPLLPLAAIAVGVAAVAPWLRWWWGLAPLAGIPFAALLGLLRFRDTGWAIDAAERLVVRGRDLARTTTILPRRRLQRRGLDQNLLQRRARLASFAAAVASGGGGGQVRLQHLDAGIVSDLLGRLGPASAASSAIRREPGPVAG